MENGTMNVQQNRELQINWRAINVPSLAALAALFVIFWNATASHTENQVRTDARLDAIEAGRQTNLALQDRRAEMIDKVMDDLKAEVAKVEFRIGSAESAIVSVTDRQDRFADALGDLRDGIAKMNTSIEVLTQRLETTGSLKRSGFIPQTPLEFSAKR